MEDKHIYSTSFWSKLQDRYSEFGKEIQSIIKDLKPKRTKKKSPTVPMEPLKKEIPQTPVTVTAAPEIKTIKSKSKNLKVKKPKKEKIKKYHYRKLASESVQKTLVVSLAIAIITIFGVGTYLTYKDSLYPQTPQNISKKQETTKPTSPDIPANWEIYQNNVLGLSLKHPPDFLISENNGTTTIYSRPYLCKTIDMTLPNNKQVKTQKVSEVKIDIKELIGENYSQIWKKEYGFDLIENVDGKTKNNYDGVVTIGGKKAYYFNQGAEMTFGRKAILIEKSPTSAISVNSWTPILIQECEEKLNNYNKGISDKVLFTFKFLD